MRVCSIGLGCLRDIFCIFSKLSFAWGMRVHIEFTGGNLFFIKLLTIYYSIFKVRTLAYHLHERSAANILPFPITRSLGGKSYW